ncbi:matrix-binding protein [Streptococcus mitis]|uniref:Matrix-binding protein n=2 Tax=Streptococcus mitis TaxID=28037 RepID=A0A1X1K6G7_STRMT|nr:matrix-binding protein [Streptococcus mitis]
MSRVERLHREKVTRYSIRKVSFGAASVAVAALFMFLGNGAVAAAEPSVTPNTGEKEILNLSSEETKDNSYQNGANAKDIVTTNNEGAVGNSTTESKPTEVETLNKKSLIDLIAEIEGKFAKDTYANKTEDSVNQLKTVLNEAKSVLNNAKTQAELSQAHAKLVTATTKLQTKPEDKKEAPAVETTNGKVTVGIKATNTEKANESNSIANSGSRDQRNGKALDANNPFRIGSTTTDTDASANQTYTAPAADANLETLSNELKNLPNFIENNKKIQDMDTLGNALNVKKGSVNEIHEFGGWKAVGDSGKFAIARKTEAGVFPIETVNTVWADSTKSYVTWVLEQSFNRDSDYMLFLSKVRTKASSKEEAYDNSTYVSTGLGDKIAKGVKGFDGIQKTFKAYSKEHGSKVIVKFKTGYTGDINGTKAQYKVEVIINRNGQEEKLYDQTFTPEVSKTNSEMNVVKASDGTNRPQNFSTLGTPTPKKEELEAKIASNKPNGTGGTFTSKEITLPEGVTEYTVRISSADNMHLGMGYQSPYRHYALPVTGLDFNIDQDTGAIAKDLLSRIYDKLKATETADTDGKTNETKAAYLAELENIKTLVTSTDVKKTAEYKTALESILSKQLALKVDKTGLTDSKTLLDGLVNEDPTPGKTQDTATAYNAAKQEAIKAIDAAKKVIDNTDATVAQVREALATVNAKKTALQKAKDDLIEAATAEEKAKLKADADSLVKADTTGKTPKSIEVYNTKYEAIKAQLETAKTEAAAVLAKENNASKAEVQEAQTKVDAAKAELTKAAELLVNKADKTELTKAKEALNTLVTEADPTTGKTADSAKSYNDAKTAAEEAIKAAETVINDENATQDQVTEALNKVNEKKATLEAAKQALVEAATVEEKAKLKADVALLTKADETGKTPDSITAYERKYEELKTKLEEAKAEAEKVLEKGNNATKEEVKAAQAKVDAVKTELENAKNLLVEAATTEEKTKLKADADSLVKADTTGKTADSIKAYEAEFEKLKTQLEEAKAAAAAVAAKGDNATKTEAQEAQAKVDAAKTALEKAAELLKELDRDAAKKEIADAAKKATDAIEASTSLTPEQKAEEKAKVAKEAKDATDAIDKATTEEGINSAKDNGKLAIEKEAAITAINAEKAAKEQEIDKNAKLSDEEKAAAKAEVAKAAIKAVEAIQNATTQEAVDAAKAEGETAIKAVNPIGKEQALESIQATKEAKLAEIDKNTSLSAEEKAAAKAAVEKAYNEAVEAIQNADTQEAVDAAKTKGEAAINAINPIGKEKALESIQATKEAKLAEIDKNTSLSDEEKAVAKAAVEKAYNEAVEAIQNADTQEAVDAAKTKGEAAINAINPSGKELSLVDINEAKAAVEAAAAEKIASIKANPNLSDQEKAKAIAEVERLKQEALNAIDKAKTKAELDKVLRTFLYQLNQDSLVYERPSFDLEAFIQSSITGVVQVELGKAISQADIIAKLNLPENVTIISIELPDTNTLGDKFAKVILRLADGTEITVKVPVRVVASQSGESKPETSLPDYGRNNGTTNTDVKVDKAKLEGAIRQLDELIIKESAKLDAETAKEAQTLLAEAKDVFANAKASQAEVDAMVKRIEDFMAKVAPSTDHATPANDQAAQTPAVAPATTQAAANASQTSSAQANTRTVAKELPNTGTADSVVSMVAAAASALLGLGLAGRRKEDEEA